mmetsp:Transcript_1126/g.2242  ORF Transcript_1126/g.2242 Transcript_1126/m.2242 type:complete len:401 (+) Transcript_1126:239-1441(+)
MFVETFLGNKNEDCLEQVLSFLNFKDLTSVAWASKSLHQVIFQDSEEHGNINVIWEGAEVSLTHPWDVHDQPLLVKKTIRRVGSNVREHCRLFAIASKAAKAYESSDGIEEDRIMVDDMLANLMNVRGYGAESVAEKTAIRAEDEALQDEFHTLKQSKFPGGMKSENIPEFLGLLEEYRLQRHLEWERVRKLTPPQKTYHHEVFVRITRASSGEVISEGFCKSTQKLPWHTGLELPKDMGDRKQGLEIVLDFESLIDSEDMKKFLELDSEAEERGQMIFGVDEFTVGLNITAVVVDKRDSSVKCLFQQDQTRELKLGWIGPRDSDPYGVANHGFCLHSSWGNDIVQLGPCSKRDQRCLWYSLSLNTATLKDGGSVFFPMFDIYIQEDGSFRQTQFSYIEE